MNVAAGPRAHIGLIVPPSNTVNESEWRALTPPGVTLETTRMALHQAPANDAERAALYADLEVAIAALSPARPSIIAYGCTAGSMVSPVDQLSRFMTRVAGCPCVTTMGGIIGALRALETTRIAVATPYHEALNQHERHYLEQMGFEVLAISGLGIGAGGPHEYAQIASTPVERIRDHVLAVDHPSAEAILVSCTDFPTLSLIGELETLTGKPVVSSNTATFWATLRSVGLDDPIVGGGRLLAAT